MGQVTTIKILIPTVTCEACINIRHIRIGHLFSRYRILRSNISGICRKNIIANDTTVMYYGKIQSRITIDKRLINIIKGRFVDRQAVYTLITLKIDRASYREEVCKYGKNL